MMFSQQAPGSAPHRQLKPRGLGLEKHDDSTSGNGWKTDVLERCLARVKADRHHRLSNLRGGGRTDTPYGADDKAIFNSHTPPPMRTPPAPHLTPLHHPEHIAASSGGAPSSTPSTPAQRARDMVRSEFGAHRMRQLSNVNEANSSSSMSSSPSSQSQTNITKPSTSNNNSEQALLNASIEEAEILELEQAILQELLETDDRVAECERYEELEREAQAEADALGEEFAMCGLNHFGGSNTDVNRSYGEANGYISSSAASTSTPGAFCEPTYSTTNQSGISCMPILCPHCKQLNVQWKFGRYTCPCGLEIGETQTSTVSHRDMGIERVAQEEFDARVRVAVDCHKAFAPTCSAIPVLSLLQSSTGTTVLLLGCSECGHQQVI